MPRHERIALYEDPRVYDILHAAGTGAEVRGLERIEARFVQGRRGPRAWLEPACGTGRYLRAAARCGHHVVGFDQSPVMIAYARARVKPRRARLFVADKTRFARLVGRARIALAFNLINTIRHLESDAAMLRHLREMARVLRAGGVYAVGLSLSLAPGREAPSLDVWRAGSGRSSVRQAVEYFPPRRGRFERVVSRVQTRTASGGGAATESRSEYRLRCYTRRQWEAIVSRAGWTLAGIVDENGRDHDPGPMGYAVWVLRPPTRPSRTG